MKLKSLPKGILLAQQGAVCHDLAAPFFQV